MEPQQFVISFMTSKPGVSSASQFHNLQTQEMALDHKSETERKTRDALQCTLHACMHAYRHAYPHTYLHTSFCMHLK